MEQSPASVQPPKPPASWKSRLLFGALNLWLVYHIFSIVVAPASVGPASPLEFSCWRIAAPYLQTLNLNHGYHFFAPDPAGSAIVSYVLEFKDGRTMSGRFPNRSIQPRLLYHRHFMLSEFLAGAPPAQQKLIRQTFARHLVRKYGAEKVTLSLIAHALSSMDKVKAGVKLDDPSNYSEEPLGTFSASEL